MQISNNTSVPSYNSTVTNNNDVKNVSSGFDALLNEQKRVSEKEEGKVISFLEKHSKFDSLSNNDKKVFKDILADDNISMQEMDSLSYDQAQKLFNLVLPKQLSKEDLLQMPITGFSSQIGAMLFATQMTKNEDFNKAMYKTSREITSDNDRQTITRAVHFNLSQAKNDKELDPFFSDYEYRPAFNEIENINSEIDFSEFLSDIIEVHKKGMEETKFPTIKKQYQDLLEGYTIVQRNYNDVLNEKKDTYV
ncbi:MAG: hypothetical protein WCR15_07315 [Arcobacteraceae bacterium]